MFPLFETIELKDGVLQRLNYHENRLNESRKVLFVAKRKLKLAIEILEKYQKGVFRCRVSYGVKTLNEAQFFAYTPIVHRQIKLIECSDMTYSHKWEDRNVFKELLEKNKPFDEIIITKNGFLYDTSYSNLAFFDGQRWLTPSTYLLKGTRRTALLEEGMLEEKPIHQTDLKHFQSFALINAMRGLELALPMDIIEL